MSTASPVSSPRQLRIAMLGMVAGNGHPFSWSAIINGRYDASLMAQCGYPAIPQYLDPQPPENLGIPGAKVTHVWCDRREDAERVSRCAYVDHVLARCEDAIGHVDAAIIATDIGSEHVRRARPFIEAGVPVFVDKPMVDNEADLRQFARWQSEGKPILSTSCMRYANEFIELKERLYEVGEPRLLTVTMMKSWERYGIHAVEAVYGLLPPGGWRSVVNTGTPGQNLVHATHASGADIVLSVVHDLAGAFGHLSVYGTQGRLDARFVDTFTAFKSQLRAFVNYVRDGVPPFAFDETIEQMKIIIAGIRSREENGRRIPLTEIRC